MKRMLEGRTDLRKEIPLDRPIHVVIDIANICNFKCRYCMGSIFGEKVDFTPIRRKMTLSEFKEVINAVKIDFNRVKLISPFLNGEPFINEHICEMIDYISEMDVCDELRIVSNASLLTPVFSLELASTLNRFAENKKATIQFSIQHVNDTGYKEVACVDVSYEKILLNIAYFYANVNHKNVNIIAKIINDNSLSPEDIKKFKADFSKICDDQIVENAYSRHENLDDDSLKKEISYDGHSVSSKKVCNQPFYVLHVTPDLKVKACTSDGLRLHDVGDFKKQSLREIWEGENLYNFRKQILLGKANEICKWCACFSFQLDDIDDVADELLERLTCRYKGD